MRLWESSMISRSDIGDGHVYIEYMYVRTGTGDD